MFQIIAQGVMMLADGEKKKNALNENAFSKGIEDQEAAADLWEDNAATNKSIAETNLQNTIRTGYKVGMLNVQRGQSRKMAAGAGLKVGKDRLKALGQAGANAAAAGAIGASVDAVASDIEMQAEQAQASLTQDYRITEENYDNELTGVLQAGEDAIMSPQTVSTRRPNKPRLVGNGEAYGSALIAIGSQWMSSYMSLGLGKKDHGFIPGSIYSGADGYAKASQSGLY